MDRAILNEKIVGLLKKKCAILKESRDKTPQLLILPDLPEVHLHDINILLEYLVHVAWSYDPDSSFNMVVDRRSSNWPSVRNLFSSLQKLPWYEKSVKEVYLLNPTGLLTSVFRLISFTHDKKVIMVQSSKEIDELFLTPFHSLSQSQTTSVSTDQSNQSFTRSVDQSQKSTETSSLSPFSMLQRAAQSQRAFQKTNQSRKENLCVLFIDSFNPDNWIEDRKTIESLHNYMVSMQNALKPHPSSSYPDDDDEEDEGGDDNDDNRCNNTKQKEETADKTTEDQNASKTLKPPRPPQPSLSSSQTQPFSSSSSSSSVDHHTKITSFLPTPLTGTNSLSSPSSSLSPSSVLHQILSSTPPPIITPTYNEIKAKSLKQLKAIKKSRLSKYHRVLDKMAATHASCEAIIKSFASLPSKTMQLHALRRISSSMASTVEEYRRDVGEFEVFMGRVLCITQACGSVRQLRVEREKEDKELEMLCQQYNLTKYLSHNRGTNNTNNSIDKINNKHNSTEKSNNKNLHDDNEEKHDGNRSEKKILNKDDTDTTQKTLHSDSTPKIKINDDDQKTLNIENDQKTINNHDNKDGGWDTFRQSPISWEKDLDIFKNSNEIHNIIDKVEDMRNTNQVRQQTLSEKQSEIIRLAEEMETGQKEGTSKTLNKNSQISIDRNAKAMERTQTHSKLLEELTNTYKSTQEDMKRDAMLLTSLSKHLGSCLQLYTELDKDKYICSQKEEMSKIVDDTEEVRIKRRHVIGELIETEKAYTNDLRDIINGYMEGLSGTSLLQDRENIFGNIKDIYQFHSGVFLKCLQESPDDPVNVAQCFIQHKQSFLIYMTYCQNKVNSSDVIMNSLTDVHPCFEQCRQTLGHRLPLSSYLLKPVQRITKYHLILRDLSKVLITWEEVKMMNKCMQCIQEVVRQVNNSLHQLSILNYPGDLRTLGRLLFQGMLEVSVEKKSTSPIRPTNLHKRHVFLYDREILLCKKKENTCQHPSYIFKTSLKNDEIGPLRDKEDRRFEVVNKSEVWCFVAALQADKLAWVEEIKRVLFEQMQSMRSKTRRIQLNNSIDAAKDAQRPSSQLIDSNNNNVVFYKSFSNNK